MGSACFPIKAKEEIESMSEASIMKNIQINATDASTRLYRNNVGKAWQGKTAWLEDALLIKQPRRVNFGLCEGSSDLIGYRSIEITPDMVGKKVAIFVALEVKTETGRTTDEQTTFIEVVKNMGGLSGIARSIDDANWILNK